MPFLSIVGALFSGWISKAMAFLAKLPWQVWATLAGIALALFLWHSIDASAYKRGVDAQKALTDQAIAAHKVTRASLNTCIASIDEQNRAVEALGAASVERAAAAERAIQSARAATVGAEAKARSLEASAGKAAPSSCKPSGAFVAAREGL